jgi:hypothetical protein
MKKFRTLRFAALLACGSLAFASAYAKDHGDKDEHHAQKEHEKAMRHIEKEQHKEARHAQRPHEEIRVGTYFDDRQRVIVRDYYSQHYGGRHGCPPGLAKKHNGCMPPGQARHYAVGEPLRVSYYAVPQPVLVQLRPAPVGYRYVSVNGDILLVALGSMIVVDALGNLLH